MCCCVTQNVRHISSYSDPPHCNYILHWCLCSTGSMARGGETFTLDTLCQPWVRVIRQICASCYCYDLHQNNTGQVTSMVTSLDLTSITIIANLIKLFTSQISNQALQIRCQAQINLDLPRFYSKFNGRYFSVSVSVTFVLK